jgi:PPOX class probable F420-dependent enzyme
MEEEKFPHVARSLNVKSRCGRRSAARLAEVKPRMLSHDERRFLASRRVGHLATADRYGAPHVVPVCFAFADEALYITIDEKPKRADVPLKRLRNIAENPAVAVVVDRYDDDWTRLGWVMLRGAAEILTDKPEHARAQALLRARYPQLNDMQIASLPVIAVRIERVTSWGNLADEP